MDTTVRERAKELRARQTPPVSPSAIDLEVVRKLALLQCNLAEVASFLEVPESVLVDTPEVWAAYQVGVQKGRRSLRRKMMTMALAGDRNLLIWLSKNYLSMRDAGSIALGGGDKPLAVDVGVGAEILAEALGILAAAGAIRSEQPNGHEADAEIPAST
tara:strand:+ start:421 stop:897 length:477 start_codon:yes stop_codon:yes gene_type:complete